MSENLLNPVLFTVLGDPISLAKLLSIAGLALDIGGVLLLLFHDLRTRELAVEETRMFRDEQKALKRKVEAAILPEVVRRGLEKMRPQIEAREALRKTRLGFRLLLAGFILQLLGALAA